MKRDIDILEIIFTAFYKLEHLTKDERAELFDKLNSIESRLKLEMEEENK